MTKFKPHHPFSWKRQIALEEIKFNYRNARLKAMQLPVKIKKKGVTK